MLRDGVRLFFLIGTLAGFLRCGVAMAESSQSFDEDEVFESGLNIREVEPKQKKHQIKPTTVRPRLRPPVKKIQLTVTQKTETLEESKLPQAATKESPRDVESNIINSMLEGMEESTEPAGAGKKQAGTGKSTEDNVVPTEKAEGFGEKDTPVDEAGTVGYWGMVISTLFVIGFIFLFVYLWKMVQTRTLRISRNNDPLKVLAQQTIGPHSKIVIIEALGKKYLVGATQERIQLLADLDLFGSEGVPLSRENPENEGEDDSSFAARIFSHVNQTITAHEPAVQQAQSPSHANISEREKAVSRLREKLKSLKKFS